MVSSRASTSRKREDARVQAVICRDVRSNGAFVYAVKTTGIFCRPSCPARPKPENIVFFDDAVSAQTGGYRACKRCRPEVPLAHAAAHGTRAVLERALRKMKSGNYHREGETLFAEKLGIGGRQLRRIFEAQLGVSPKRYADELRLQSAFRRVLHSDQSFTEISEACDFGSIRRFNSAFKSRFQTSPTQARDQAKNPRKVSK